MFSSFRSICKCHPNSCRWSFILCSIYTAPFSFAAAYRLRFQIFFYFHTAYIVAYGPGYVRCKLISNYRFMLDYPCSIWPQCADCRSVYACALLACWQCGQRMLPMHNAMRSSEIVAHVGNAPPSVWLAVFFHHCLWIVCEEAQTQKQIDGEREKEWERATVP